VIDGATATATATATVGSFPGSVGVDPSTDTVYVSNDGSDTESVIAGATNTVIATVTVGSQPRASGSTPRPIRPTSPTSTQTPCR
jgi:YVTN family beta-propeller protein